MCRAISPGSQSKDSEHIFSSLESGPAPPLAAVESTSVGAGILPSFPSLFRLSFSRSDAFSLSPSSSRFLLPVRRVPPRSKHADTSSPVRGVSSEMKGGNQRLQEGSGGKGRIGHPEKGGHTIFINAPR